MSFKTRVGVITRERCSPTEAVLCFLLLPVPPSQVGFSLSQVRLSPKRARPERGWDQPAIFCFISGPLQNTRSLAFLFLKAPD